MLYVTRRRSIMMRAYGRQFFTIINDFLVRSANGYGRLIEDRLRHLNLLHTLGIPRLITLFLRALRRFLSKCVPMSIMNIESGRTNSNDYVMTRLLTGHLVYRYLLSFYTIRRRFLTRLRNRLISNTCKECNRIS